MDTRALELEVSEVGKNLRALIEGLDTAACSVETGLANNTEQLERLVDEPKQVTIDEDAMTHLASIAASLARIDSAINAGLAHGFNVFTKEIR